MQLRTDEASARLMGFCDLKGRASAQEAKKSLRHEGGSTWAWAVGIIGRSRVEDRIAFGGRSWEWLSGSESEGFRFER
ncbi:hypothetical protein MA16_Dca014985 [Dendrobium catenatum]|uniref:Uncharacterized protein n=1 Tax=Dendrobium catenatum TaxID=906689 RepID=A0A2I0VDQ8_9ASPA|nr:hypothetical protein MA16_Dca014985 [Dendrobium catenatum]